MVLLEVPAPFSLTAEVDFSVFCFFEELPFSTSQGRFFPRVLLSTLFSQLLLPGSSFFIFSSLEELLATFSALSTLLPY